MSENIVCTNATECISQLEDKKTRINELMTEIDSGSISEQKLLREKKQEIVKLVDESLNIWKNDFMEPSDSTSHIKDLESIKTKYQPTFLENARSYLPFGGTKKSKKTQKRKSKKSKKIQKRKTQKK